MAKDIFNMSNQGCCFGAVLSDGRKERVAAVMIWVKL